RGRRRRRPPAGRGPAAAGPAGGHRPGRGRRTARHRGQGGGGAERNPRPHPLPRAPPPPPKHLFPPPPQLAPHIHPNQPPPALAKPADLLPFLTNLEEGSILFIDEIHRTPRVVEEFIYPAMEDFRIDIVLGEGVNARTISMQLKRFTLIGATTRGGMLSGPM